NAKTEHKSSTSAPSCSDLPSMGRGLFLVVRPRCRPGLDHPATLGPVLAVRIPIGSRAAVGGLMLRLSGSRLFSLRLIGVGSVVGRRSVGLFVLTLVGRAVDRRSGVGRTIAE